HVIWPNGIVRWVVDRGRCHYGATTSRPRGTTSSLVLLNSLNLTNELLVLRILGVNRLHGLLEWSLIGFQENRPLSLKFVHGFLNQLIPQFPLLGHRVLS